MYFILNFRFDKIQQIKTKANKLDIRWEFLLLLLAKFLKRFFANVSMEKALFKMGILNLNQEQVSIQEANY